MLLSGERSEGERHLGSPQEGHHWRGICRVLRGIYPMNVWILECGTWEVVFWSEYKHIYTTTDDEPDFVEFLYPLSSKMMANKWIFRASRGHGRLKASAFQQFDQFFPAWDVSSFWQQESPCHGCHGREKMPGPQGSPGSPCELWNCGADEAGDQSIGWAFCPMGRNVGCKARKTSWSLRTWFF